MANLKISQLPSESNPTVNDLLAIVNSGVTKKVTVGDLKTLLHQSHNVVTGLTANTPLTINHNFNNENIIVQTWSNTTGDLVTTSVTKTSGDTANSVIIESTITETFRINILGL
jgi:hypothetical protein